MRDAQLSQLLDPRACPCLDSCALFELDEPSHTHVLECKLTYYERKSSDVITLWFVRRVRVTMSSLREQI
jgi:hypothetical protein